MYKEISTVTVIFAALLFATYINGSDEARILALLPLPGTSHMIFNTALPKELARRGHDVTVISPFTPENPIPNYKVIPLNRYSIPELMSMALDTKEKEGKKRDTFDMMSMSEIALVAMLWGFGNAVCSVSLGEEPVRKLINSNEHFDLIILESFYSDCFLGFAHKFKAPVIQICAFGGTEEMGDLVGNPNPYAYVPDPFQEFSDKMSFKERLLNVFGQMSQKLAKKYFLPNLDKSMRKHFNDPNMPSIEELEKLTAMVMVNHHFSISYPRPLVPNFIEVGGMHIKPPKKLPADLQKYMDDAPDGVIYFSMGSNLKSANMPEKTVNAFVSAFSKLKQKVIWKWEAESLPGQPANLKLVKWLPQSDILAHPNLRLFMTHGGLLSTQETIDRGVPVIGIPIFGDQRLNMIRTESLGFGKLLEFHNVSEESLAWTIKEVLENPKYRENAQRLSRIYRDQPMTPLEKAVYWAEYVIRHKGAPHMRSAALDLTWYQYFLLDVISVLVLAVAMILLIMFFIFRALFRICCNRSKRIDKSKKRN